METLPKTVNSGSCISKAVFNNDGSGKKSFAHCNICRNYKNINDLSHRRSKAHQKKLTERFRIIRSKIKIINLDSPNVHDEEWHKEETIFCYFCNEPVLLHKVYEDVTVEFLGYLSHLTDFQHKESVKSYLARHERKDKWQQFSKATLELENFMSKIPNLKAEYLKKLEDLNQKDVMKIKEVELQRQNLVQEALQQNLLSKTTEVVNIGHELKKNQHQKRFESTGTKVPPWLMSKTENGNSAEQPVIGPTMDTLVKHVQNQKKKGLPSKLLTGNFHPSSTFSNKWLPKFGGVWNKGRHRRRKCKIVSKDKRK